MWQFAKNIVHPMTLRRRRTTDCKFQVPDHQETSPENTTNETDCISQVSRHGETGRIKFQSGFKLSKKAFLVNP